MQEDVEHRTVMLAISTAKFTGRVLKSVLTKWLAYVKDKRRQKRDVVPHGKQTVQQLARQNQGMTSIEIKDEGIREFERIARKYGVDFAIKKVKGQEGQLPTYLEGQLPTYLVFFKGRDTDALTAAFTEYTEKRVRRKEQPSFRQTLAKLRAELAARKQEPVQRQHQEISR